MRTLYFLFALSFLVGCKHEELLNANKAFGISFHNTVGNPDFVTEIADSLILIDLSTKTCSNIASVDKFPNLSDIMLSARSINKNVYIYRNMSGDSNIGLIDLSSFKSDHIALNNSKVLHVLGLHVDEIENIIYAVVTSRNELTKDLWLGLLPIIMETKVTLPIINIMDIQNKSSLNNIILSEIDYKNKRIFIMPMYDTELFIFNYKTNNLQQKQMDGELSDLHYNSARDCLFGSGNSPNYLSLFEYSLTNDETKIIGNYLDVQVLATRGFYYDRVNNSYWINTYFLKSGKLLNINLSDATVKDSIILNRDIQLIN